MNLGNYGLWLLSGMWPFSIYKFSRTPNGWWEPLESKTELTNEMWVEFSWHIFSFILVFGFLILWKNFSNEIFIFIFIFYEIEYEVMDFVIVRSAYGYWTLEYVMQETWTHCLRFCYIGNAPILLLAGVFLPLFWELNLCLDFWVGPLWQLLGCWWDPSFVG